MANRASVAKVLQQMELVYGREVPMEMAEVYLEDFADIEDSALMYAASQHRKDPERGRFFPTPADIIAKLPPPKKAKPPHADAAWSIAINSFDEKSTVVWTKEIAGARQAALPVWNAGDKVGARMAFKAAYEAILARLPGNAIPKWEVSPGHSPEQRLDAITRAQVAGLLSPAQAQQLLPHFLIQPTAEGTALTELVKNATKALPNADGERARPKPDAGNVLKMPAKNEHAVRYHATIKKYQEEIARRDAEAAERKAERERKRAQDKEAMLAKAEAYASTKAESERTIPETITQVAEQVA